MSRVLLETPATFAVTLYAALAANEESLSGTLDGAVDVAAQHAAAALAVDLCAPQPQILIHCRSGRTPVIQPHVHVDVETSLQRGVVEEAATVAHSRFQQRLAECCVEAGLTIRRGLRQPCGWALGPEEHEQYTWDRQPCPDSLRTELTPLLRLNRQLADTA